MMINSSVKMLALTALVLLTATPHTVAQDLSLFTTPCKTNADCVSGVCLTSGANVNGDPSYFYCEEPSSCDPNAPSRPDGTCNNLNTGSRLRGSTGHMQLRRVNGTFTPAAGPRSISDTVGSSPSSIPNNFGASTLLVYFGQFVDHDTTLVHESEETEVVEGSGVVPDITFHTSEHIGAPSNQPMLQNQISAWLDLTQVYGATQDIADQLRSGTGGEMHHQILKEGGRDYLPYTTNVSVEMIMGFLPGSFAAGDIRANEHVMLLSLHTLFLREHNRLAREFSAQNPGLSDDELYALARKWNIAQYQNIALDEFFFAWHREALPAYAGYDDQETPDVDLFFSTASFRFGHSTVVDIVKRIDDNGTDHSLPLAGVFFNPNLLPTNGGVDSWLKGAMLQCHERVDTRVVDALRNALFENIPGVNGTMALDLLTLNLARGRDHQLPKYTDLRAFFGLSVPTTFDQVTGGESCLTAQLEQLYGVDNVEACDPFICGLAEPATRGEMGELFFSMQRDQFKRFRNADRFYFENTNSDGPGFSAAEIQQIKATRLHDILRRNTFLNDVVGDENFAENAFQTDACCRTTGNVGDDTICVNNQAGGSIYGEVDHCTAVAAIHSETEDLFFAGSENFDCACNFIEPVVCPHEEDGALEVLLPPLLDEDHTHLIFSQDSSHMQITIHVPKQYLSAKFDFEGALNPTGSYDSNSTASNEFWSVDYTSDPCNVIYTSSIPWDLLRTVLDGMNEERNVASVCYSTEVNIEVTREVSLAPETLLEDKLLQSDHTRYVRTKIPFEVCFNTQVQLWGTANVISPQPRVTAAITDASVLSVDPDASPLANARVQFVTAIPLPLYLDAATIETSNPLLATGLSITEITELRDCEPQAAFCTQFWNVDISPEQCTLGGRLTATVHAACSPGVTNCVEPTRAFDDIAMDISSDDFCGVTQEVAIEGSLSLAATACNGNMLGTVNVFNADGFPINSTTITELHVAPTLADSQFLTVYDQAQSVSILDYSAVLTAPDQVDFQFQWLGAELRCDVVASVDVVVLVEFEATAPLLLSMRSSSDSSRVNLLTEDETVHMNSEARILAEGTTPSDTSDSQGAQGTILGLSYLQVGIVGGAVVLMLVMLACFVYCCRRPSTKKAAPAQSGPTEFVV